MHRHTIRSLICIGTLVIATACSAIETKPKEFRSHSPHKLHAAMRLMAEELAKLSNLSLDSSRDEESKTAEVLAGLDQIEAIASDLGGDDIVTNYSVINRYMGAFLYDVQLAREFALRDPPNHFPASTLVKSCLACHQSL